MGVESRPMTDKERGEFTIGADKPGESADKVRIFRRIPETAEERQRHVEKVTAQDAEALGGIRAIIEQAPISPATKGETAYGQALAAGSAGRVSLDTEESAKMREEYVARHNAAPIEATAIVERPQPPKKSWLGKLLGK